MALLLGNFVGFETGGLDEAEATASSPNVQNTYKHTGGYALQVDSGSGDNYRINAEELNADVGGSYIFGCWIQIRSESLSDGGEGQLIAGYDGSSVRLVKLRIKQTSGVLNFGLGDIPGTTSYGSTAISTGTWYFVEVHWDHTNNNTATLYVNGSSETTLNGDYFQTSSDMAQYIIEAAFQVNYVVDDFYCYHGASGTSDFLGGCEVYAHVTNTTDHGDATPTYNGVTYGPTALDTGNWDDINDYTTTNSAIYSSGNAGGAEQIDLNAGITENPVALKAIWYAKKSAAGTAVQHYGVYGNSSVGDDVSNTQDWSDGGAGTQIGTDWTYLASGTESAAIVPTAAEKLRIGFEVKE